MSEFITIAVYADELKAQLARGALEQADIPCFLADEYLAALRWVYAPVGGLHLKIAEEDIEKAVTILLGTGTNRSEFEEAGLRVAEAEEARATATPEGVCPCCGGTDITGGNKLLALVFLLVAFLPYPGTRYRCKTCWHRWK